MVVILQSTNAQQGYECSVESEYHRPTTHKGGFLSLKIFTLHNKISTSTDSRMEVIRER